jgi:hypothetical protein
MNQYDIDFWYQLPGWDEYGKEKLGNITIHADNKIQAEKTFKKMQKQGIYPVRYCTMIIGIMEFSNTYIDSE